MENIENIRIIVELLKQNNIRQIVISPGGTNIPFVKAVQDDNFFTCYSVVDERSAIYFAIGLYLQTGEIIATSCTSAQATRNYIPGLTEAYYKKVPILAITMAKHPRFTYQEYMQAPDQTSLPKDSVKESYMLPFISRKEDLFHSIRLVNEAIQMLTFDGNGPVQICVPWLDFELDKSNVSIKKIDTLYVENEWAVDFKEKKIMIVIGEHIRFDGETKKSIDEFCETNNAIVYTNHLSNFCNRFSVNGNSLLSVMESEIFENYAPDVLITIGGQTGDYPLYNMLSQGKFKNIEHWRVSEDGRIVDTYDKLTKVFKCSEKTFFERMKRKENSEHSYFDLWNKAVKKLNLQMALPFSNASIAQYLCEKIPPNSIMQFSILNSLRIWNFFQINPNIECFSNVGAFGIDGGMSTLIGQSIVSEKLSYMIIGDLAFLYDINSISIRHIKPNLRILLVNNNGGIEFKYSKSDNDKINRYIAAGNHFKNAQGWAETCGFKYIKADSMDEFVKNSKCILEESERPIIFEIFVSDIDEAEAYEIIINNNKIMTASTMIKQELKATMKDILGENRVKKIKNILK